LITQDPLSLGADAGPKTRGPPSDPSIRCPTLSERGLAHPKQPTSPCGARYARERALLGSHQAPLNATRRSGLRARVSLEQGHLSAKCLLAIVIII